MRLSTIKLVRHGQSTANVRQRNPQDDGDHTTPLTELGHQQAEEAGRALGRDYVENALIFVSPYLRTRQTLDGILRGAGVERAAVRILEDPRLREADHGYSNVPDQKSRAQKVHGKFYYRFRGGESPADCYDRTSSFLDTMHRELERKGRDKVLLVTHGITIRCFVMRFLHLPVSDYDTLRNPKNTAIVTISRRDETPEPYDRVSTTPRQGWVATGLDDRVVYFAHGKLSSPKSSKIAALRQIARSSGFVTEAPDYSDELDPGARLERLEALLAKEHRHLTLVGSSMGGYVSTRAAARRDDVSGLFLMAPAFYMDGYPELEASPSLPAETLLLHGLRDDVVPIEHALRFAKEHLAELVVLDACHRLHGPGEAGALHPEVELRFERFLSAVKRREWE